MFKRNFIKIPVFIFTLLLFLSGYSQERKIHVFPLIGLNCEPEIGTKYTGILFEKLQKTEIFDINKIEDFSLNNELSGDIFTSLKNSITTFCQEKNIKTAVYGYISKKQSWYDIKVVFYSAGDRNIITSYDDRVFSESFFEESARNCAVHVAARMTSIQGTKVFVASAFCPGLGQILQKKYIKGAVILSSFAYLMYKYANIGNPVEIVSPYRASISMMWISNDQRFYHYTYYRNDVMISQEDYNTGFEQWYNETEPARQRNQRIKDDKNKYKLAMGAAYLINILDTIFFSGQKDIKRKFEEKLSFELNPWGRKRMINFNYRF